MGLPAQASTVMCSSATGVSNVFTNQSCSPMFAASATLDWGSPISGSLTGANSGGLGPATNHPGGGPWPETVGTTLNAAVDGDAFTITSNDSLTRADNTEQAWNGTNWTNATFVNPANNYFAGHFGAPSTPTSQPPFGDNLLGAIAPPGGDNGPPIITLTFAEALSYVAFQVSSANNTNFTAQLLAFNSLGVQIGTYQIMDTGAGGFCAGLANNGPQPCNDAPLIQFYDPTDSIKSVELILTDDDSGVYIDTLMVAPIPEPVSSAMAMMGLLLVLWGAKRKQLKLARAAAGLTRD